MQLKNPTTVSVSVYYNDGTTDPYNALQDWLRWDSRGKWLSEYEARLVYLDTDQTDENYMNTVHAQFVLAADIYAAYKFKFQSICQT